MSQGKKSPNETNWSEKKMSNKKASSIAGVYGTTIRLEPFFF
jgi:hypothetical protein